MTLTPKNYSPEGLRAHAEGLRDALQLTTEQGTVLAAEIRNTLCPLVLGLADKEIDEEARGDMRASVDRILALMNALNPPPAGL